MIDLQLGADEGIMLENECATWISGGSETELDSLILTNKNIYYVYTKSNGMFAKATTEIIEKHLADIKVINNQPLVEKIKGDYGINLQIQYTDSRDRFYFNERSGRTADVWVNEINKLIMGEELPTQQKEVKIEPKVNLSEAKGAFSGFASGLKKMADSAIQTATDSAKQYAESDAAAKHKENIAGAMGGAMEALSGIATSVKNVADDAVNQIHDYQEEKRAADAEFRQILAGGGTTGGNTTERTQEFAGVVLKCPNCGSPISQTTVICPDCGHRITGQSAVSSVQAFSNQLMLLETKRKGPGLGQVFGMSANPVDNQKLTLIQSYPIPNTIDDIQEFMLLAIANIDVALSKNTMSNRSQRKMKGSLNTNISMPREISDAWVSKMQQAYQKAKMLFPEDSAFAYIKQLYSDKMKELKMPVE